MFYAPPRTFLLLSRIGGQVPFAAIRTMSPDCICPVAFYKPVART